MPMRHTITWSRYLPALLLLGAILQISCDRIDPVPSGPVMTGESVMLTCEGCHTERNYLRRLALEDVAASSGGG